MVVFWNSVGGEDNRQKYALWQKRCMLLRV